ncbi:hypothetical protein KP509_04G088700 [Ceratopteris richardii]|nr:hypothetical protein KP509_04G088700 [Ceratopteris richardii]
MVYPTASSSWILCLIVQLIWFLLRQTCASELFCTETQAADGSYFVAGNRSLPTFPISRGGEHSDEKSRRTTDQLQEASRSLSDCSSSKGEGGHVAAKKHPHSSLWVSGHVPDEYIVRFTGYKHASEHRKALERALDMFIGWKWIDRVNPASSFPTDFALLKVEASAQATILRELKGLPFVKDVSVQSQFSRGLMEHSHMHNQSENGSPCTFSEIVNAVVNEGSPFMEGKRFTAWTEQDTTANYTSTPSFLDTGRKLLLQRSQITSMFGAEKLWARGFTGAKVRMAVFDTGVRADHPHFRNIKERTNWTNEDTLNDNLGHGTFVAGVISSQDSQCLGFAPDAEIFAFRVFTDAQ